MATSGVFRRLNAVRRDRTSAATPTATGYRGPDRRVRLAAAASAIPMSWPWLLTALAIGVGGALALDLLAASVSPHVATVVVVLTLCFLCGLLTAAACAELVVWKLSGRAAHAHRLGAYALLGVTCGGQMCGVLGLSFAPSLAVLGGGVAVATGTAAAVAKSRALRCPEVDTGIDPLRSSALTMVATGLVGLGGYGVMAFAGVGFVGLQAAAAAVMSVAWALVALRAAMRTSANLDSLVPCVSTTLLSLAAGMSAFSFPRSLVMATVVEGAAIVLLSSHALMTLRAVLSEEQSERRELADLNVEAEVAMTEVRYRLHDVVAGLASLRTDAARRALVQPRSPIAPEVVPPEGPESGGLYPWEHEFDALLQLASRQGGTRAPTSVISAIAPLAEKARHRGQTVRLSGADLLAVAVPGTIAAVLGILLDNAARHARTCSVAIVVSSAHAPDGSLVVEVRVRDDGPGVGAQLAGTLFLPGVGGADGGQGLGLSSARRRAQASGGDLFLDTADGRGACFVLRLPADEPSNRSASLPAGRDAPP